MMACYLPSCNPNWPEVRNQRACLKKKPEVKNKTILSKLCETQRFRLLVDRWAICFGGKSLVENYDGNCFS